MTSKQVVEMLTSKVFLIYPDSCGNSYSTLNWEIYCGFEKGVVE